VISPLERARVLDAEMQLQRAWLEISLRDLSTQARESPWGGTLNAFKLGKIGLSIIKHRSIWLTAVTLMLNFYRRHTNKGK
jgi:hypothetical protein